MSLRPNERAEVRRNRYKVAVDAEEGRRRREDNMVEIRKNRREESLLKRRRVGLQAQAPAPPSGVEKKFEAAWALTNIACGTSEDPLSAATQAREACQLPALVEFTDVGLDDVGDNDAYEDYEVAAEDTVVAESTVQCRMQQLHLPRRN